MPSFASDIILIYNARSEYDKWQRNDPPALPFEADVKLFREFYVQEINDLITLERFFQSDYVYLIK